MMNTPEKFIILMEKEIIKEIYGTKEMEYAIIHLDRKHPVEGVWVTVETDLDIKSVAAFLPPPKQSGFKRYKRALLSLLRLKFLNLET